MRATSAWQLHNAHTHKTRIKPAAKAWKRDMFGNVVLKEVLVHVCGLSGRTKDAVGKCWLLGRALLPSLVASGRRVFRRRSLFDSVRVRSDTFCGAVSLSGRSVMGVFGVESRSF